MVLPRNGGKLRSDKPKLVSHEISHYLSSFWLVNAHEIFSISIISYSWCVYANISYEIPVIVGLYRQFLLVKSPTDSISISMVVKPPSIPFQAYSMTPFIAHYTWCIHHQYSINPVSIAKTPGKKSNPPERDSTCLQDVICMIFAKYISSFPWYL